MSIEWRDVPGWEGLYQVSDDGQVRSLDRIDGHGRMRRGRVLSQRVKSPDGYLRAQLCRDAVKLYRPVHQLVAEAFYGPRPLGQVVRHLDGNPANNQLANLAYGTQSENELDKVRHGTHYPARKTHCPAGHEYDLLNTYFDKNGHRQCRACQRYRRLARKSAA